MRAFLLASATSGDCQPTRAFGCVILCDSRSERFSEFRAAALEGEYQRAAHFHGAIDLGIQ